MKRKIRVALISCGVCWVLLGALQSSFVGYFIAGVCGIEYYSEWKVARKKLETEGELPPAFCLKAGGSDVRLSNQWAIVPCLLFYDSNTYNKYLGVDFTIPQDWNDAQCLDLTKLEVVLPDGRRNSLLSPWGLPRFYIGDREDARRSASYNAGHVENVIEASAKSWSSPKKVTLIAEGIIYKDSDESLGQPFRQVSEWRVERKRGFRKMGMP